MFTATVQSTKSRAALPDSRWDKLATPKDKAKIKPMFKPTENSTKVQTDNKTNPFENARNTLV